MAVVALVLALVAAHVDLLGVDHDDEVARVDVRRVLRLALAAQHVGDLRRQTAERLAVGVDQHPVALAVGRLCYVGLGGGGHGVKKATRERGEADMITRFGASHASPPRAHRLRPTPPANACSAGSPACRVRAPSSRCGASRARARGRRHARSVRSRDRARGPTRCSAIASVAPRQRRMPPPKRDPRVGPRLDARGSARGGRRRGRGRGPRGGAAARMLISDRRVRRGRAYSPSCHGTRHAPADRSGSPGRERMRLVDRRLDVLVGLGARRRPAPRSRRRS